MKNILITGGLGMIGSSLANKLVKEGHKVILLDFFDEKYGSNFFNIESIEKDIEIINLDIRNFDKISNRLKEIDVIYNFAAQVSHNDSLINPFLDADINYIGHLKVLDTVKRTNPNILIIHSGTRLQYGKIKNNPVDEDHPMEPLTPYALNKMAAENLYLFYNRLYKIPTICFRIANPYGPRGQIKHSKYGIVNWFIRNAIEDKEITIYGNGNQIRDYIYIDDMIDAFYKIIFEEKCIGKVYNIGSGNGISFKNMAKTIVKEAGSGKIKEIDWPDDYVNVETGDYTLDITKLKNIINWNPKISFSDGVRKTIKFYKENWDRYIK